MAPRRRGMVALELGRELHHLDERDEADRVFAEAAAIARDVDDPELPARVALVFHSHYGRDKALSQLRDAHRRLVGGAAPDERLAVELVVHLVNLARGGAMTTGWRSGCGPTTTSSGGRARPTSGWR
ncbi:hypothetical protein ACFQYP_55285 [Nonomuraea antimicrobica]